MGSHLILEVMVEKWRKHFLNNLIEILRRCHNTGINNL